MLFMVSGLDFARASRRAPLTRGQEGLWVREWMIRCYLDDPLSFNSLLF
jgi:hypothetical protein